MPTIATTITIGGQSADYNVSRRSGLNKEFTTGRMDPSRNPPKYTSGVITEEVLSRLTGAEDNQKIMREATSVAIGGSELSLGIVQQLQQAAIMAINTASVVTARETLKLFEEYMEQDGALDGVVATVAWNDLPLLRGTGAADVETATANPEFIVHPHREHTQVAMIKELAPDPATTTAFGVYTLKEGECRAEDKSADGTKFYFSATLINVATGEEVLVDTAAGDVDCSPLFDPSAAAGDVPIKLKDANGTISIKFTIAGTVNVGEIAHFAQKPDGTLETDTGSAAIRFGVFMEEYLKGDYTSARIDLTDPVKNNVLKSVELTHNNTTLGAGGYYLQQSENGGDILLLNSLAPGANPIERVHAPTVKTADVQEVIFPETGLVLKFGDGKNDYVPTKGLGLLRFDVTTNQSFELGAMLGTRLGETTAYRSTDLPAISAYVFKEYMGGKIDYKDVSRNNMERFLGSFNRMADELTKAISGLAIYANTIETLLEASLKAREGLLNAKSCYLERTVLQAQEDMARNQIQTNTTITSLNASYQMWQTILRGAQQAVGLTAQAA
eukprot:g8379.t1